MVRVRQQLQLNETGDLDLDKWVADLPFALTSPDVDLLKQAGESARRAAGEPGLDTGDWIGDGNCFIAGLDIALVLVDLHVDLECLIAAVLYRAVHERRLSPESVEETFGKTVAKLIVGVERMAAIGELPLQSDMPVLGQAHDQKDNIRKMLVAMVDDVRVALIKLAERTCAIRAVKDDVERRRKIGQEVFNVYAPLAHRLGIGHLKWELEDLSFRYIHADAYRKIAKLLDGKRLERDSFIERVKADLQRELEHAGLEFEIAGRAKHIYSIWRKMQHKGIGFSQVYDVRAVRILVKDVADCYATLGLVHGLWRNIPNEFDDYIANPKENGYRSLHTAVIGPEGKVLEVQIRTQQMHEEAELGVCAHWRYKGADGDEEVSGSYEEKIAWLRQVLDWHEETGDPGSVAEQFNFEAEQDRVYVFTPGGDIVNLTPGATPLDFAYHVHTEIGHRCRGAKVNGSLVPLTYELSTGEQVEILTSKEERPRRDWLQTDQGYLRTSRARVKVQAWFKGQTREDNLDAGRHLLEKRLREFSLTSVDYQRIARKLGYASVEDMYAAAGSGDVTTSQVLRTTKSMLEPAMPPRAKLTDAGEGRFYDILKSRDAELDSTGGKAPNIHLAGCCQPQSPEEIVGYVSDSANVSVHSKHCARLQQSLSGNPAPAVDVRWEEPEGLLSEVDVIIQANDRHGLLRDVTGLFASAQINVLEINTQTDKKTNIASMQLRAELGEFAPLAKLLERIARLNDVLSVKQLSP
jgi:GTP pyrophosphokinase